MVAFKIANIFALLFGICHSTQKGRVTSLMYYLGFTSQQGDNTEGLASLWFKSKLLRYLCHPHSRGLVNISLVPHGRASVYECG